MARTLKADHYEIADIGGVLVGEVDFDAIEAGECGLEVDFIDPDTGEPVDAGFVNTREDLGDVPGLAALIRANGWDPQSRLGVQMIGKGKAARFRLVTGWRRHAALDLIRQDEPDAYRRVAVAVVKTADERELRLANLRENMARKDFTIAEMAKGVRDLKKLGMDVGEIATRLAMSKKAVKEAVKFDETASVALKTASENGKLSNTRAKAVATLPADRQAEVVLAVEQGEAASDALRKAKKAEGRAARPRRAGAKRIREALEDTNLLALTTGRKLDPEERMMYRGIAAGLAFALGLEGDPIDLAGEVKRVKQFLAEHYGAVEEDTDAE